MFNLILIIVVTLPILLLGAGQLGMLSGQAPSKLGVTDGRLKPLSSTPNCVSSQASLYPDHPQRIYAEIKALPVKEGGPAASMRALAGVLSSMAGVSVIEQRPDYLRAEAQTRWLKFVDDVEFWVNPANGVIEVRSASRLGRKDFDANRQRVEAIRTAYLAAP